ncbi:type IV pilin-like G/H family protein [Microcoleus sp. N3A4]|uniref:type IV pilin-like G/H family protein n=1 Tax=Microcoleus sp. N3A4 TaxID=3055379 RepID=UPI002FD5B176
MTKNQESIISKIIHDGGRFLLIIIGFSLLVDGIALPSFLNQREKKAKQSEAEQYVGSMNKAQQAYFAEKSAFATSVDALGIGIKTETINYKYSVRSTKQAAFNYGVSQQKKLKSYVGAVFAVPDKEVEPNAAKDEISTIRIFCQADDPGTIKPADPTYKNGKIACGQGTTEVTK